MITLTQFILEWRILFQLLILEWGEKLLEEEMNSWPY